MTADEILERARAAGLRTVVGCGSAPQPYVATAELCPLIVERQDVFIQIGRPEFRSEGYRQPYVRLDTRKARRTDADRVDAFLRTAARLQAREGAIVKHGQPELRYPAWSFRVDALALALARARGIDLADCTRPATWRRAIKVTHGRLATPDEAWDWSRETTHVRGDKVEGETPGCGVVTVAEMKGDRLVMRVLSGGGDAYLREETGRTLLHIDDALPETVLVGLAGRRVADIADIDTDHVVTKAFRDDAGTALVVKGPVVPVAPPPEGVHAWWLDV